MSSVPTVRPRSTVYTSAGFRMRRGAHHYGILVALAIATCLTMLGAATTLAGLSGILGIATMGIVRSVLFIGLGLAGAGAGGLLLVVLAGMRSTERHRRR